MSDKYLLSGAEAVFGFCAWITTRDKKVVASAKDDASIWAELADEFCKTNGLKITKEDWHKYLVHPKESQ